MLFLTYINICPSRNQSGYVNSSYVLPICRSCGIYSDIVSAREAEEICPLLRTDDIVVCMYDVSLSSLHMKDVIVIDWSQGIMAVN